MEEPEGLVELPQPVAQHRVAQVGAVGPLQPLARVRRSTRRRARVGQPHRRVGPRLALLERHQPVVPHRRVVPAPRLGVQRREPPQRLQVVGLPGHPLRQQGRPLGDAPDARQHLRQPQQRAPRRRGVAVRQRPHPPTVERRRELPGQHVAHPQVGHLQVLHRAIAVARRAAQLGPQPQQRSHHRVASDAALQRLAHRPDRRRAVARRRQRARVLRQQPEVLRGVRPRVAQERRGPRRVAQRVAVHRRRLAQRRRPLSGVLELPPVALPHRREGRVVPARRVARLQVPSDRLVPRRRREARLQRALDALRVARLLPELRQLHRQRRRLRARALGKQPLQHRRALLRRIVRRHEPVRRRQQLGVVGQHLQGAAHHVHRAVSPRRGEQPREAQAKHPRALRVRALAGAVEAGEEQLGQVLVALRALVEVGQQRRGRGVVRVLVEQRPQRLHRRLLAAGPRQQDASALHPEVLAVRRVEDVRDRLLDEGLQPRFVPEPTVHDQQRLPHGAVARVARMQRLIGARREPQVVERTGRQRRHAQLQVHRLVLLGLRRRRAQPAHGLRRVARGLPQPRQRHHRPGRLARLVALLADRDRAAQQGLRARVQLQVERQLHGLVQRLPRGLRGGGAALQHVEQRGAVVGLSGHALVEVEHRGALRPRRSRRLEELRRAGEVGGVLLHPGDPGEALLHVGGLLGGEQQGGEAPGRSAGGVALGGREHAQHLDAPGGVAEHVERVVEAPPGRHLDLVVALRRGLAVERDGAGPVAEVVGQREGRGAARACPPRRGRTRRGRRRGPSEGWPRSEAPGRWRGRRAPRRHAGPHRGGAARGPRAARRGPRWGG